MDPAVHRNVTLWLSEGRVKWSISDLKKVGYNRDDAEGLDPGGDAPFDFTGLPIRLAVRRASTTGSRARSTASHKKLTAEETKAAVAAAREADMKRAAEKKRGRTRRPRRRGVARSRPSKRAARRAARTPRFHVRGHRRVRRAPGVGSESSPPLSNPPRDCEARNRHPARPFTSEGR